MSTQHFYNLTESYMYTFYTCKHCRYGYMTVDRLDHSSSYTYMHLHMHLHMYLYIYLSIYIFSFDPISISVTLCTSGTWFDWNCYWLIMTKRIISIIYIAQLLLIVIQIINVEFYYQINIMYLFSVFFHS